MGRQLRRIESFCLHDKLCLQGKWTSSGGEAKLFSDPNYTLKWYGKTKRKLVIVRDDCDQNLRQKLSEMVILTDGENSHNKSNLALAEDKQLVR